ncbi:MAG: hypothetical protein SGPRY_004138 [Prymnesium sp.]
MYVGTAPSQIPRSHTMSDPKYGGAYVPLDTCTDQKPEIDRKCGAGCTTPWQAYQACAARIEEKVLISSLTCNLTFLEDRPCSARLCLDVSGLNSQ